MLSFFKKDPLHEELKRAKRIKKVKDKLFWKKCAKNGKRIKRISLFVSNDICPDCGKPVKLKQTIDDTDTTDNHYTCTICPFQIHFYCDDEDDEW